jgi:hypothetical protein
MVITDQFVVLDRPKRPGGAPAGGGAGVSFPAPAPLPIAFPAPQAASVAAVRASTDLE